MSARTRRALGAPVAVLALAGGLLAGCTAATPAPGAGGAGDAADGASASAAPSASPTGPAAAPSVDPSAPPPDLTSVEPPAPDDDQADAYLEGRVPDGVDPAAVLEAGVEACARMRYLAAVDADVLVEALRDDPDAAQWPDAVEHLCPDLSTYVDQAGR
ncbi:MAG: hypothetical protein J7503_06950 [Cellulomonas iranensis]|uniref:DUF732 domain-containing protein n=1 Tax=Cellulomonas iranensis TaxID=76862 RepID=A0ABU0GGJ9_9CELL|nr:hypothetical protein [Cellulomonas iranensis]MBO9568547.1 hypothetical protein [Cellulomonas iranensis]MDQ0424474.1 hypothetical protein [Cellulomonas iranensis]